MIVVNAVIESTEQDIAALKDSIAVMEQKSQAEDGCHDYAFSVELGNPDVIRITEKWDSMEVLAAHFQEPHMAAFQAAISVHPPKSITVTFYEATEVPGPWPINCSVLESAASILRAKRQLQNLASLQFSITGAFRQQVVETLPVATINVRTFCTRRASDLVTKGQFGRRQW